MRNFGGHKPLGWIYWGSLGLTFLVGVSTFVLAQDPSLMDLPIHPGIDTGAVNTTTPTQVRPLTPGFSPNEGKEKDPRDEPPPVIYGEEIDAEGGTIVFVLDRSGSMDQYSRPYATGLGADGRTVVPLEEGPAPPTRMEAAKQELTRCISSLAPNIRFNVYAFDCQTIRWSHELQPADPGSKASAIAWVNGIHSNGATGTGPAMVVALSSHRECLSYVLLTDGEPNCGFDSYIHRRMINDGNTQRASITVFGIDAWGGHRLFCQWVAADSGGSYFDVN